MNIDDQIIARDRAMLAQAEYDQAHVDEILAEEGRKHPEPPMVPWWGWVAMAAILGGLAWWWTRSFP